MQLFPWKVIIFLQPTPKAPSEVLLPRVYVSPEVVSLNKACLALSRGTPARTPGVLELVLLPGMAVSFYPIVTTSKTQYPFDSRAVPSGEDKFLYQGNGSSRLDCGDEVRHPSRLVSRMGETRSGEVLFGTLNVCGSMDDKIDICELMKYRRLDILCVNETKRKAIIRGSFDTYWSGVDQS
ncbi:hypothetical protein EVAR_94123_1 [Eumeta japonica]|uniref:Uncharacterized protein n=1 Tax=Eumeta variegata TaxID=151549 RepID=A0A4C1U831_EUMVA|nr:hypothetical protein EVAR_94123_1 [Eumeta japonica]